MPSDPETRKAARGNFRRQTPILLNPLFKWSLRPAESLRRDSAFRLGLPTTISCQVCDNMFWHIVRGIALWTAAQTANVARACRKQMYI